MIKLYKSLYILPLLLIKDKNKKVKNIYINFEWIEFKSHERNSKIGKYRTI